MNINPTSQIHAAIHARNESSAALQTTILQSYKITQSHHSHIVHFQYLNEETGELSVKSFDGKKWS